MEAAILEAAQKSGVNIQELQADYTLIDEFSFNNTRKMASYIYEHENGIYIFSNGAPETILERSVKTWTNSGEHDLDDKEKLETIISNMARKGWRLLGLGYRLSSVKADSSADAEKDLVFVGISARPEVGDAIRSCQEAGIRVILITGDHPETAKTIAAEVGINNSQRVLFGVEISKLRDEELKEALKTTSIFARTTPEHKLRIVRLLIERARCRNRRWNQRCSGSQGGRDRHSHGYSGYGCRQGSRRHASNG